MAGGMRRTRSMAETNDRAARRVMTLVRGEATGGRLAVVELHEVQGHEPPRHLHANEDEIVYVLAGALTVCVGEDVHRATAGACLFLPRGTEHGYAVESGSARLLVVLLPAGFERFFEEADAAPSEAGVERLIAVAARYGVAITGPAPTAGGSAPDATSSVAGTSQEPARSSVE